MIIIRKSGKIKDLYYLSSRLDLHRQDLYPSIPNTELTKHGLEDKKIPSISLFPSVGQGIAARDHVEEGEKLAVYVAKNLKVDDIFIPSITQSPRSSVTDERWAVFPVSLEKVAEIEVGPVIKEEIIPMGPRGTKKKISFRSWKDLRPEWEQKKRPILEQREFGLRSWVARQFRNSAAKDLRISRKAILDLNDYPYSTTPHLEQVKRNIRNRAENIHSSYIHTNLTNPKSKNSNYNLKNIRKDGVSDSDITNIFRDEFKMVLDKDKLSKSNNLIIHNPKTNVAGLSHEVGHSINRVNISDKEDLLSRANFDKTILEDSKDPVSLRKIFKKRREAKLIQTTENLASKNGLKEMKISGASPIELKDAKKYLKIARKTYKSSDVGWKKDISNFINPKKNNK